MTNVSTTGRKKAGRRKAGATLLAALLLCAAGGGADAQNAGGGAAGAGGGTGVSGNNGAGGGATGAGAGAAGAGNNGAGAAGAGNAGAGATGAGAPGAGGATAGGATNGGVGAGAGGAGSTGGGPGGGGATGVSGNTGVNAATATGTGGALSSGGTPGGSVPLSGSPAPQHYDIARTIVDALRASADVQTAVRNVDIDRKQSDYQASKGRPTVNAQGQATRYDQATAIAIGGSPPITVTFNHAEVLSLNLGDQLDISGQIRAASDQYRLQSLVDQFVLEQTSNARVLRAKNVYFNLLQTYHQVQVAQANLADAEQNLQDTQNQNAAGTGLRLDLLRAQTQVAQDQQQLEQAQNMYGVAQSTFNDLVGRPLGTPITLDDVPGVTVGLAPTSAGAVGATTGNEALFPPPTAEVAGINLDQSLQTAYTHRPEILADRVSVRVAETGIKLARAGLEPTLRLDANGLYYPTPDFQTPRRRVVQATATLTIPLYDGNGTHDLVQEAHDRRDNAQTNLESQTSDVTLDVRQSYLNLLTAAQQIASANAALQSAVAARQNAEIRYRGGVGLFLEVTDAQAALVQAQNSQIVSVYNYQVARAQFENAIGVPQIR